MKKVISWICSGLLFVSLLALYISYTATVTIDEAKPVSTYIEMNNYSYSELKEKADIIAMVEVVDGLDSRNTVAVYGEGYYADLVYSVRHAKVIKVYKNSTGRELSENILIKDMNGVAHDKYYYTGYGDEELITDNRYVLFLNEEKMTKKSLKAAKANKQKNETVDMEHMYSILSTKRGKVNLTNTKSSQNALKIKFMLDYETQKSNSLIKKLLTIDEGKPAFEKYQRYYGGVSIDTNYGTITVQQAYTGDPEKLYFEVSSENEDDFTVLSNFEQDIEQ